MSPEQTSLCINQNSLKTDERIMLLEMSVGGHYPSYINHLINYWCEHKLAESLDIVVSPQFLQQHADVVTNADKNGGGKINFISISQKEQAKLKSRTSSLNRYWRYFQEWNLLCKYAKKIQANHCLITIIDAFQFPLAFGKKSPCPVSGIYFRPSFHYCYFPSYQPSRQNTWQRWREKLILSLALKNPQLKNIFCLDSFVIKHIEKFGSQVKAIYLPDPVQIIPQDNFDIAHLKAQLGIKPGRKIFLLLGQLNRRRGIYQLLEAIKLLPSILCEKICLVLIVNGDDIEARQVESQIQSICQSQPVQIIRHYQYVSDQEVHLYHQLTDVVLAIHQQHIGMSGSLVLAAAYQKPVLSSNYGLMGEIVTQYNLGLTIDSTIPQEITRGLEKFLLTSADSIGNRDSMTKFAQQNSAKSFASTIFQNLNNYASNY